jgi:hypothetical protein
MSGLMHTSVQAGLVSGAGVEEGWGTGSDMKTRSGQR